MGSTQKEMDDKEKEIAHTMELIIQQISPILSSVKIKEEHIDKLPTGFIIMKNIRKVQRDAVKKLFSQSLNL